MAIASQLPEPPSPTSDLAAVLLRRLGRVYFRVAEHPDDEAWLQVFEMDLLDRGWLLNASARHALSTHPLLERTALADWTATILESSVGGHRPHVPLFRRFPDDVPSDTDRLYVERMLSALFQLPDQPCVLCGTSGTVHAIDPCAHLVCSNCFDGSNYSACPICNRQINATDSFFEISTPQLAQPWAPIKLRVLDAGTDIVADAHQLRDQWLSRTSPLSVDERVDLECILNSSVKPGDISWLPEDATRHSTAIVLAWVLEFNPSVSEGVMTALQRWSTATDVARTIWAYSGNDPSLVLPPKLPDQDPNDSWRPPNEPRMQAIKPRVGTLGRPLRRAILTFLDSLPVEVATEDVLRHPTVWKRIGERLHPFRVAGRFPNAAVAFAVLRSTSIAFDSELGRALLHAIEGNEAFVVRKTDAHFVIRFRTFASLVEEALETDNLPRAIELLTRRPGEFGRRLDVLARRTTSENAERLVLATQQCAPNIGPNVLLTAWAEIGSRAPAVEARQTELEVVTANASTIEKPSLLARIFGRSAGADASKPPTPPPLRSPDQQRRVFLPKGGSTRLWDSPDHRPPVVPELRHLLRSVLDAEAVRRLQREQRFDIAMIDARLRHVPIPIRTSTASGRLEAFPRGTVLPLPHSDVLRFFLHWIEPSSTRVDLDLSAAFFDADWKFVGLCDYTNLRFKQGAVHSGDLTSAPAPTGATEFLDLDLTQLRQNNVRHVIPVVYSYNSVGFEHMDEAFAGFSLPTPSGQLFEPGRVLQRFDLLGDARALVPMHIDLHTNSYRWMDFNLSGSGYGQNVRGSHPALARLCMALADMFNDGRRATTWDVALWHAACRAETVVIYDGRTFHEIARVNGESDVTYLERLRTPVESEVAVDNLFTKKRAFVATLDDSLFKALSLHECAPGSIVMTASGAGMSQIGDVSLVTAEDLSSELRLQ